MDQAIVDAGEDTVMHIFMDNPSNNMSATNMQSLKRPNIFWMSSVAYTVN